MRSSTSEDEFMGRDQVYGIFLCPWSSPASMCRSWGARRSSDRRTTGSGHPGSGDGRARARGLKGGG